MGKKKIGFGTYEGDLYEPLEDDVEIEVHLEFPSLKITVGAEDLNEVLVGLGLDSDFHAKHAIAMLPAGNPDVEAEMRVDNIATLIELYSKTQHIEFACYDVSIGGHSISEHIKPAYPRAS